MAAVVVIGSGHSLRIEEHRRNQPNKSKLLYVTGFERTRLPRTQQEDALFTITR